jgi:hypothetical protein
MIIYRNVAVDSVKTGMGGKLGNKGCVSIYFLYLLTIHINVFPTKISSVFSTLSILLNRTKKKL